jgi:hypothetical protein
MGKRNKRKPKPEAAASVAAPAPRPRRAVVLSVAFICAVCLFQYWGILSGGRNFWEDIVEGEFPSRAFAKTALFGGEFPHWNPFTFGGMPFFATGAGILYPFNLLLSLLPVGGAALWYLMQAVIALHALIAGLCMFAFLRFKGRTNAAAAFGAASFMAGGYIVAHIIHPGIFYIAAWLPLMLLLMEKGIRDVKPRYMAAGGLLLGAVMQVGHAQVMFYALIFMLTYAVFLSWQCSGAGALRATPVFSNPRLRGIALAALYFAVAAGLCAVQYLPLFEAGGHTVRSRFTITDASQGSLQFVQLLTALLPKVFGAYTGGEGVPSFWLTDAFQHGYYNYWESCFYFGVSTLILSFFAFRKFRSDRAVLFYAAWVLLSFLIALGGNFFFYKMLFKLGIPGFNSFRHAPRILFVWAFAFPMLAAAALDGLNEIKASGRLRIVSITLCAAAAALGLLTAAGGLVSVFPEMNAASERAQYAKAQGWALLVNAALFGAALALFFKNVINEKTARILVVVCVSIDMLVFAAGQHITRGAGADAMFKRAQSGVEEFKKRSKGEIVRVNTRQFIVEPGAKLGGNTNLMTMMRNQGYVSAVEITEGYNQFRLKYAMPPLDGTKFNAMLDLMNIGYYVNPYLKDGDGTLMLRNATCLPRAKLFYKAVVVGSIDNDSVNDIGDSLVLNYMNGDKYDHHNEIVVADKEFEKFSGGQNGIGKADIARYKFNRIELDVDTDKEAILWLSEIWYPAWKAFVNGKRVDIYRTNYSFRTIIVPAGHSKVVFKFDSIYFNIGAAISLLTLIASVTYLLLTFRAAKRRMFMGGVTGWHYPPVEGVAE